MRLVQLTPDQPMDLGFHMRRAMAAVAPVGALDFDAMVASLAADQAQGATARAAARLALTRSELPRDAALATVFLGLPGWVGAAALLCGSFDQRLAAKIGTGRKQC